MDGWTNGCFNFGKDFKEELLSSTKPIESCASRFSSRGGFCEKGGKKKRENFFPSWLFQVGIQSHFTITFFQHDFFAIHSVTILVLLSSHHHHLHPEKWMYTTASYHTEWAFIATARRSHRRNYGRSLRAWIMAYTYKQCETFYASSNDF